MFSRRRFLQLGVGAGGGLFFFRDAPALASTTCSDRLSTSSVARYVTPLVIPPVMPMTGTLVRHGGKNLDYYEIAVRQFSQQVLPLGLPSTTVWSYGSVNHPGTFNYPAFTIEARWRKPVAVKWINDLKDANGDYLPHLLPVDPTLHWANPPGGIAGRDERPTFTTTPGPYTGPVPIVTHLHGGESTPQESDGYPEAWYLPDVPLTNGEASFARTGSLYEYFRDKSPFSALWTPGSAVFEYPNDQRPTTLW
ncbi:MAG: bilirubin oxidase, partial [Byssovorax sp.]